MKEKIEVAIKTLEAQMENSAIIIDKLHEIEKELDQLEVVSKGTWEDINDETSLKRCSNCGRSDTPTLYCKGCGSRNTYGQNA